MSSDWKQNTILIVIDLFVLGNDGFQFFFFDWMKVFSFHDYLFFSSLDI